MKQLFTLPAMSRAPSPAYTGRVAQILPEPGLAMSHPAGPCSCHSCFSWFNRLTVCSTSRQGTGTPAVFCSKWNGEILACSTASDATRPDPYRAALPDTAHYETNPMSKWRTFAASPRHRVPPSEFTRRGGRPLPSPQTPGPHPPPLTPRGVAAQNEPTVKLGKLAFSPGPATIPPCHSGLPLARD